MFYIPNYASEEDISDVLDELKDVTAQCYQIGTMLGLKASDLDLINSYVLRSSAMLKHWRGSLSPG